jgi:hypothetical protein
MSVLDLLNAMKSRIKRDFVTLRNIFEYLQACGKLCPCREDAFIDDNRDCVQWMNLQGIRVFNVTS